MYLATLEKYQEWFVYHLPNEHVNSFLIVLLYIARRFLCLFIFFHIYFAHNLVVFYVNSISFTIKRNILKMLNMNYLL